MAGVTRNLFFEAMKLWHIYHGEEPNVVYFPQDQLEDLHDDTDQWGTHESFPPRQLGGIKTIYHDGPLRFDFDATLEAEYALGKPRP